MFNANSKDVLSKDWLIILANILYIKKSNYKNNLLNNNKMKDKPINNTKIKINLQLRIK